MKEVISSILILTSIVSISSCRQNDDELSAIENVSSLKKSVLKGQTVMRGDSTETITTLEPLIVETKDPPPKDGGQWKTRE